ncbi:MAG: Hpt domain-containing protein, partial [Chthoniobacteraceae bacterium]|nr:Hpt domain-containing protein [Chthoniobacteraceae bacterium]
MILAVSYFGTIHSHQQGIALFLLLVVLNGGFLFSCIQLVRKLRASKRAEAERESQLQGTNGRLAQTEQTLRETRDGLAKSQDGLAKTQGDLRTAQEELTQANELFDNYSLQLEITTSELKATKAESEAILANVKQGVFLIGHDGTIGRQFSLELKKIFQIEEVAGRDFVRLLRPLIPEKRHQTIGNYLQLLFNPRKNEKQLQRFNPLKCVELNFQRPEGGFAPKHVEFNFQRVFNGDKISRVLVTAVDVSERVQLESRLREGEERREKQLELLCDLLNAETAQLRGFLKDAQAVITDVNATFRAASNDTSGQETTQDKVNRAFRIVHKLKSQAASLGLRLFEQEVHQIEDLFNEVRRNPRATNEDLLNVLVAISHFQGRLEESGGLIEKIAGLRHTFGGANQSAGEQPAHNTPSAELMRGA